MATSWDAYLQDQSYQAASYDPYSSQSDYSYMPDYRYSEPTYYSEPDYQYDAPEYDYAAYSASDPYGDPGYGYQSMYAAPAPSYQAPPPVQEYVTPPTIYQESGYTLGEQVGGGYVPSTYTPVPQLPEDQSALHQDAYRDQYSDQDTTPYQPPDTRWLSPAVDPSRNPPMPEPYVAPPPPQAATEQAWQQGTSQAYTSPYQTGDAYSTGDQNEGLWRAFTPSIRSTDPGVQMDMAQQQRAIQIDDAEARAVNLARLDDQRQLEQARLYRGEGRVPEAQMLSAVPPPQETWLGERFSDLGTWGSEVQHTTAPVTEALGGGVRSYLDRLTTPYQQTATTVDQAVDLPVPDVDLSRANPLAGVSQPLSNTANLYPWETVEPNTPLFGGLSQSLAQTRQALGSASSLPEYAEATITGVADFYNRPLAFSQEEQGRRAAEMARLLASGDTNAYADIVRMLPTERLPVLGQAGENPIERVAQGSPELWAEVIRIHDEAEAVQPGSGGRAVWEYYQNPAFRNMAQRAFADTVSDPLPYFTGGTRLTGGGLSAWGRALQASSRPGVRAAGTAFRGTGGFMQAAGGVTDELADMGLTTGLSGGARRIGNSRLGRWARHPFQLTDEAAAEAQVSGDLDAVGGLIQTNTAAGRPPAPPPIGDTTPVPPGGNGFLSPDFNNWQNTTTRRFGDYRIIQNGDTGEAIVTHRGNSEVITPRPLTFEEAEAVLEEIRAGATIEDAASYGESLRVARTAPPAITGFQVDGETIRFDGQPTDQPLGWPQVIGNEPDPATMRMDRVSDEIILVQDTTGRYWLYDADTMEDIFKQPLQTIDEARGQFYVARDIVQQNRLNRAAQGATATEVTGRTTAEQPLPPEQVQRILGPNGEAISVPRQAPGEEAFALTAEEQAAGIRPASAPPSDEVYTPLDTEFVNGSALVPSKVTTPAGRVVSFVSGSKSLRYNARGQIVDDWTRGETFVVDGHPVRRRILATLDAEWDVFRPGEAEAVATFTRREDAFRAVDDLIDGNSVTGGRTSPPSVGRQALGEAADPSRVTRLVDANGQPVTSPGLARQAPGEEAFARTSESEISGPPTVAEPPLSVQQDPDGTFGIGPDDGSWRTSGFPTEQAAREWADNMLAAHARNQPTRQVPATPGTMPEMPAGSRLVNDAPPAVRAAAREAVFNQTARTVANRVATLPADAQRALTDLVDTFDIAPGVRADPTPDVAADPIANAIYRLNQNWVEEAQTPLGQIIDDVVAQEFGVGQVVRKLLPDEEALRRVVRAIYDQTQDDLRQQGRSTVTAYRGRPQGPAGAKERALTSWTTDREVAERFAKGGQVQTAGIPAARIYSTAETGLGDVGDREILVLAEDTSPAGSRLVNDASPATPPSAGQQSLDELASMPPEAYNTPAADARRRAMYQGGFLRKSPSVIESEVRPTRDGQRWEIFNPQTNHRLTRKTYGTEDAARAAQQKRGDFTAGQQAAHQRFVDLQVERMQTQNPVDVELSLRKERVPRGVIARIKAEAQVADPGLPPAPNGHAVTRDGQRVLIDNPANRLGFAQATPAEAARAGFQEGQSLRERMERPGNVRRTLGQADADTPTQARFEEMPLAVEEKTRLRRPMLKTHGQDVTLGDATLNVTDDVYLAKALADDPNLSAEQQKQLTALADRYGHTPDQLAAMDEGQLDELVFERIADDLRRELVVMGGEDNIFVQTLDSYLRYRRSVALYNKLRVPGYIMANVVGNGITTGLFKPSAIFGRGMLWDPRNLFRIRDKLKDPARFGDKSVYGGVARSLGYTPRFSVVNVHKRDQLDYRWGYTPGSSGFSKTIAPKILSEEGYWVAQAVDQAMRESIATDVLRSNLPQMIREIRVHAKNRARELGVGVSDGQIDAAIDALVDAAKRNKQNGGLPAFSQTQLKQALGDLPTLGGEPPAGWAERISRDWREATGKLMADADAEVNRLAFTFRQTNIDRALSKVVLFHYWASRASFTYMKEAMKNPWMMAAYFRATEGLNRFAEENNWPDSIKGALQIFDSIGGYAGFFRPELILPQFLMMSETVFREEGEYGLTMMGQGLQWLSDHGIGVVPLWREFTYNLGLEGGTYRPPDSSGAAGPMDTIGAAINILNASGVLGKIGLEYGDNGPEQMPAPAAELRNQVAHWISGLLADNTDTDLIKQVPLELEGFFRGERELGMIVADLLAEQGVPTEEIDEQVKEIMAAADGPTYDEAYDRWSLREGVIGAQRVTMPGGAGQVALRNVGSDERREIKRTGTPAEQQAAWDIDNAVNATPESAAYDTALDAYYAAGDDLGHQIAGTYFRILDGDTRLPFKVNGQEYTRQDVQAMSKSERYDLAQEWMDAIGAGYSIDAQQRMETRYDAQNELLAANPEVAAAIEFRTRAEEYGPGVTQFILDTAAINKPYAQHVNSLDEPVGHPEWQKKALSTHTATMMAQGIAPNVFDAVQDMEGAGRVAGLPEETTLANAWHIRQAEREAEDEARATEREEQQADYELGSEYIQDARRDLPKFGSIQQRIMDYDPSGAQWNIYLDRVSGNEDAYLDDPLYDSLQDEFESIWPSGGAEEYIIWANGQPSGADLSFDAWREADNAAYDARQERIAAENPDFDPATLVGGTSEPLVMPGEEEQVVPAPPQLRTWGEVSGQTGSYPSTGELPVGAAPAPAPGGDLVFSILGGADTNTDYGFKAPTDLPFYGYFEGHGGTPQQHTGIDATGIRGQEMYTPMGGTVTCAGSGNGGGSWGTGCAEFNDDWGGAGRLEIMLDDGSSLIFGHAAESYVTPGQRVNTGELIGLMGTGEGADHVHIERRVWDPITGTYVIVNPEGNPVATYAP